VPRDIGQLAREDLMLITEHDAKADMWCPMVRVRWQGRVVAYNRVNPGHGSRLFNALFRTFFPRLHWLYRAKYFRCWGSGCMMWRWERDGSPRGYCGLAGSPVLAGLPEVPSGRDVT
jgi:hypothetical protein